MNKQATTTTTTTTTTTRSVPGATQNDVWRIEDCGPWRMIGTSVIGQLLHGFPGCSDVCKESCQELCQIRARFLTSCNSIALPELDNRGPKARCNCILLLAPDFGLKLIEFQDFGLNLVDLGSNIEARGSQMEVLEGYWDTRVIFKMKIGHVASNSYA